MDSSEQRYKAWQETKSKDEETTYVRYSLFLQLDLPKGVLRKAGVLPSWHLSPSLRQHYNLEVLVYQEGGLHEDPIT